MKEIKASKLKSGEAGMWDSLMFFKHDSYYYLNIEGEKIKRTEELPLDVTVTLINIDETKKIISKADKTDVMSHIWYELLTKEIFPKL